MNDRSGSLPAKSSAGPAAPRRSVWWLALLVVLGHWLLLAAIPHEVQVGPAIEPLDLKTLVFNTRRIEVPAPVTQVAPVQPRPVLFQKPKPPAPAMVESEPVTPITAVAEVSAPESPFPVKPPVVQEKEAESTATGSAAADNTPAELPVASEPAAQAQAQTPLNVPGSVRLKYKMTGLSDGLTYHATGVMTWRQDGSRYEASMVVSAFLLGSRSLESMGDITADGLAPKRFADKGRRELAAHFQADKGKISFSANTPEAPWKRGAQDRLSVFFQLASLLAGQPAGFPLGTKIPIYTVGPRDVDTWTFTVAGEEALDLPHGAVTAIKLTRDPRREFDQRIEAWFAPSLGYWPVRMKITQHSGDYIDQQLSSSGPP